MQKELHLVSTEWSLGIKSSAKQVGSWKEAYDAVKDCFSIFRNYSWLWMFFFLLEPSKKPQPIQISREPKPGPSTAPDTPAGFKKVSNFSPIYALFNAF